MEKRITPENITELKENEIFVFGSNEDGLHYGGAAKVALEKFGAVFGQGVGLYGQTFAIPTCYSKPKIHPFATIEEIEVYVRAFTRYAYRTKDKTFYVTKIGCGIAGFTAEQIAPLFKRASELPNVYLPSEFLDVLEKM